MNKYLGKLLDEIGAVDLASVGPETLSLSSLEEGEEVLGTIENTFTRQIYARIKQLSEETMTLVEASEAKLEEIRAGAADRTPRETDVMMKAEVERSNAELNPRMARLKFLKKIFWGSVREEIEGSADHYIAVRDGWQIVKRPECPLDALLDALLGGQGAKIHIMEVPADFGL